MKLLSAKLSPLNVAAFDKVRTFYYLSLLSAIVVVFSSGMTAAMGANAVEEGFDADLAGWTSSSSLGALNVMSHVPSDQSVRMSLFGGFPDPTSYWFVGEAGASSGSFTGNYLAENINLLSFDFMAEDVVPSELIVRMSGAEGTYFVNVTDQIMQVGVWYNIRLQIDSQNAGGWVGNGSNGYTSFLNDVSQLRFQVVKNGTATQRYRFDNISLQQRPMASQISLTVTNQAEIRWSFLTSGLTYTVQAAETPVETWADIGTFTATSATEDFVDPAAGNFMQRVYRLSTP